MFKKNWDIRKYFNRKCYITVSGQEISFIERRRLISTQYRVFRVGVKMEIVNGIGMNRCTHRP